MGRNSGSVKSSNSNVKAADVSVKDIFNEVRYLNPSVSHVSSLGGVC